MGTLLKNDLGMSLLQIKMLGSVGVFEGWQRGALPLLILFLPPLKIFNDAVQADNEVSKA